MKLPKVVGLCTALLGVLVFLARDYFAGSVFLAVGSVLFFARHSFARNELRKFVRSFRPVFFSVLVWDSFFWLFLAGVLWLFGILAGRARPVADISQLLSAESMSALQGYLLLVLLYFVLMLVVLLLGYAFFKGKLWLAISNKKARPVFFAKFLLLNLFWYACWLVFFAGLMVAVKPEAGIYVLLPFLLVFLHTTTLAHFFFSKTMLVWRSIALAFGSFRKIHLFIIPYLGALFVYVVLAKVLWLVPRTQASLSFASVVVLVLWLAWFRIYLGGAAEKLL